MTSVVLVEHEATLRAWCQLHLETLGYHVVCLENLRQVLDVTIRQPPDLVLVDIDEDGVDGLALAAAIRSNTRTARLPLVFICGPDHPNRTAQAAAIETSSLLLKPLTRAALLGSVVAHIQPNAGSRIPTLEQAELPPEPATMSSARVGEMSRRPSVSMKNASVLVVTVRNFVQLARTCALGLFEEIVQEFLSRAFECVAARGGWIARLDGSGFAAVFDGATRDSEDHSRLAIETGLEVILSARNLKHSLARSHTADHVPDFSIGCGVHTGELVIARLSMAGAALPTMAGETPQVAFRAEGRGRGLGWSIAATEIALARCVSRFSVGRQASLTDTERRAIVPIFEILGISPSTVQAAALPHVADIREAVGANSILATLSGDVEPSTDDRTVMISSGRMQSTRAFPAIPYRRPERWLDRGGLSRMVAAYNGSTHEQEAIKFVMLNECSPNFANCFLEEYELAAQIDQRNVVSVRQVGRTSTLAFAAVELLAGGSMAHAVRRKLSVGVGLNYLAQMCLGLDAIHGVGIAHGGLTTEHFLFREDGTVVLADFGITQRVARALGVPMPGVASANVRYLAPERLTGIDAGPASDFYSLGVIFLEMLLGEQVVRAAGVPLPSLPQKSGRPELPLQLSPLHRIVDMLLAADPTERVSSGEDVLVELLAVRDVFPFDFAPKS